MRHGLFCIVTQRVTQGDQAQGAAIAEYEHLGLAFGLNLRRAAGGRTVQCTTLDGKAR